MKVFVSWSGNVSHSIALALRDWLPLVVQSIEPWVSSEDIEKGTRWSPAIAKELAESRAAIFCLTAESLAAPWLNFEAGAVSNTLWSANVCTYLFGITNSDIKGPLSQFQWTLASSKEDTFKLMSTLNRALDSGQLDARRLERSLAKYWPELEAELTKISESKVPQLAKRTLEDMAEEILGIVRGLQKQSLQTSELASLLNEPPSESRDLWRKILLTAGKGPARSTLLTDPDNPDLKWYKLVAEDAGRSSGSIDSPETGKNPKRNGSE